MPTKRHQKIIISLLSDSQFRFLFLWDYNNLRQQTMVKSTDKRLIKLFKALTGA